MKLNLVALDLENGQRDQNISNFKIGTENWLCELALLK